MKKQFEEEDLGQNKDLHPWKKIITTVLKDKKVFISLILSILLLAVLDVTYPLINQYGIKTFFESTDPNRFDNVALFIGLYIIFTFFYGGSVWLFIKLCGIIEARTSYELRKEAYLKLQQLSFSYFDQTPQGWIMARMTSDARKLSNIISWGCVDLLWGLFTMTGILIVLMITNIKLAVIILILLPILLVFAIFFRRKMLYAYRNARKINSEITAAYNEGFMGSKTTKSLVIEDLNREEFHFKANKYKKAALHAALISAMFGPVIFILGYAGVGATLYAGGIMVLETSFAVSALYLYVDYTIKFFDPVMQVSRVLGDFQQAQASAERIITLIEAKPKIIDTDEVIEKYGTIFEPKYENFEELIGEVEFKNVSFTYEKGEQVLHDFNLHIKAGSNVALVGHTGSGKSTIVNLICRFYEPTSGEILIDGKNYKDRSLTWLHSNLGYVLQTPQLFSGSIMENIRYGKLDATDEEVINAAILVSAHDFISKLENGYNTMVGEGGNKLSLGEKQLISFARAIISSPKILVLDEATSSIDTKAEYLIQKAIEVVLKGRTSFMIAHRLSTVVNADLILVMDEGKVVESGTHKELLALKGYYFELYRNQFQKEQEEKLMQ